MGRKILLLVVVIMAIGYLLTGVAFVRSGERAVVRRFGRVLEYKPDAGLWVGLPWGMDRVDRVEVDRERRIVVGFIMGVENAQGTPPGQMETGDHNLVNVQAAIDYTVLAGEVENYVVQSERVEPLIARSTETVLAEWIASRTVDEVLVSGKTLLPLLLVRQLRERLAPYRLGIQINGVSIGYLAAPDEVKHAFDAVTRAQTEIGTTVNKARGDEGRWMRAAQSEKYRLEQQAGAYASEQRRLAVADAEVFEKRLAMYQRLRKDNPDYLGGIWWEEMGKLFTQLKRTGQIDLLDRHLGADGLDITIMPLRKK